MPDYNIFNLSPLEFENLARDIVQKRENIKFESFADGKDGGIDFRYSTSENKNEIIIQAKRYKDFSSLKYKLKDEVNKVEKLNPNRYILAISCDITPDNKDEICKLFSPYIKKTADIIGQKDLNNYLTRYLDIEKNHFKLWFPSINILEHLIYKDIDNRSRLEFEEIQEKISVFVQTEAYKECLSKIEKSNSIIIAGIAGIGKTFLARMICYYYLKNDYEFICLHKINDGFQKLDENKKQIFYFDDFLGSNISESSITNSNDLKRFINKIKRTEGKLFVMTSRDYIQNEATSKNSELSEAIKELIYPLNDFSWTEKCNILYNHLYFSNKNITQLNTFIDKKLYRKILCHTNFNPRIIEYIAGEKFKELDNLEKLNEILDNPQKVWENSFNDISEFSKQILYALLITTQKNNQPDLDYDLLKKALKNYSLYKKIKKDTANIDRTIEDHLDKIDNFFIKIIKPQNQLKIKFINPSIFDYLANILMKSPDIIDEMIDNSIYFEQLTNLFSIINFYPNIRNLPIDSYNKKIGESLVTKIQELDVLGNYKNLYFKLKEINRIFEKIKTISRENLEKIFTLFYENRVLECSYDDTETVDFYLETLKWAYSNFRIIKKKAIIEHPIEDNLIIKNLANGDVIIWLDDFKDKPYRKYKIINNEAQEIIYNVIQSVPADAIVEYNDTLSVIFPEEKVYNEVRDFIYNTIEFLTTSGNDYYEKKANLELIDELKRTFEPELSEDTFTEIENLREEIEQEENEYEDNENEEKEDETNKYLKEPEKQNINEKDINNLKCDFFGKLELNKYFDSIFFDFIEKYKLK